MRSGLAMLVVVAGCGRIDFGVVSPASSDAGANVDAATSFVMPVQLQRSVNSSTAAVTTLSVTLANPVAAGDVILVGIAGYYAIMQLTDDTPGGTNGYATASVREVDANGDLTEIWYTNDTRPGATTITAMFAGNDNVDLWALEYSGIDAVQPLADGAVAESSTATSMVTGGMVTVTRPNSVLLAVAAGAGLALGSGTGFIDLGGTNGDNAAYASFDRGLYFASWNSMPAGEWATSTVVFSPAPL